MRNSASALALQMSLDFDQIVAHAIGAMDAISEPPPRLGLASGQFVPASRPKLADFSFAGERALASTWLKRARDNVEAIRLLTLIEREQRAANPDEQARIARFTGFGASDLANGMFPDRSGDYRQGWREAGQSLAQLVSDAELQSLKRATQYAHYTPAHIVRAMWEAASILGFKGGHILEPGCGSGLFMGLRPGDLSPDSLFVDIEKDPVTTRVAKALYPNQMIRCESFDKSLLPQDFDLAIGNPPFSNLTIRDRTAIGQFHERQTFRTRADAAMAEWQLVRESTPAMESAGTR